MMNLKLLSVITLFIGIWVGVYAQTDSVYQFSLSEAQEFGIDNFFTSKNAELDIEIAKKKIWETTAIGLPQLSGGVDYTYMPVLPEIAFPGGGDPIPMGVTNNVSYNLALSQLIFSGEYIVGLQAASAYSTFAQENYDKVKIDLKESIAGTYYGILILGENVKVLTETLDNITMNYEHTQKFYEQGLVEDVDVDQLGLVVKRTENSLRTVKRQQEYMTNLFKYQIGLESTSSIVFKDNIENLVETNIIGTSNYIFQLEEHIDYKLLRTQEDLQRLSMNREKTTFLPSITGFYQYNDQFETPDFNTNIKHILGISAAVPILSSGMRMSKVGQAKIELHKATNMKEQESQRLILSAEQSSYDYNTALQNYYNEQENFKLSEKVFNKATIRFKEGIVSSLDLSLINNQYLEAQLSFATAIQELLMAKVVMDKSYSKL